MPQYFCFCNQCVKHNVAVKEILVLAMFRSKNFGFYFLTFLQEKSSFLQMRMPMLLETVSRYNSVGDINLTFFYELCQTS